jgi:site-specific recombinase XerD
VTDSLAGLRPALADYLALRRTLGFSLVRDEKLLVQFITYLEGHDRDTVTVADTLAWVQLPTDAGTGWLRLRMSVVRGFVAYLHTLDAAVQTPPRGMLPGSVRRAVPYLYSDADITALMGQAERLRTPLRAATITTLIGLLAVTGLRIGEAIGLDDTDFDAAAGLLLVRHAKGGKERLVPLHPSSVSALQAYQRKREQGFPRPVSQALLVSAAGTRLLHCNVSVTFATLVRRAGLAARSASCRPRPHDYADLRVMPTSAQRPLRDGLRGFDRSA